MADPGSQPLDESAARRACLEAFGVEPSSLRRYGGGLCNHVYRADFPVPPFTANLRLGRAGETWALAGSHHWLGKLAPLALPFPRILHARLEGDGPFLALSHIEGEELGAVHAGLSAEELAGIARDLARIQRAVAAGLPRAGGYGYLARSDDPAAKASWEAVVLSHLERSRGRMAGGGVFDPALVDEAVGILPRYSARMAAIEPVAFLDDATTKNVLIHGGRLSGIIDLDWVCHGDRLYYVALTRMSLLASGGSAFYADRLAAEEGVRGRDDEELLDFYTLCFCLDFMSEKGMKFNRDEAAPIDRAALERLMSLRGKLIAAARG